MRITSLSLRNFKSIGSTEQHIELRPITLLFGPNSSGKSTLLKALLYLHEILSRNNCDPGTTETGGKLDLGGFRNLVHRHDSETQIELAIGLALDDTLLPSYGICNEDEHIQLGEALWCEPLFDLNKVDRIEVRVKITWSQQLGSAFVSSYDIACDRKPFASVTSDENHRQPALIQINYQHPYFQRSAWKGDDWPTVAEELIDLVDEYFSATPRSKEVSYNSPLPLASKTGAMPIFGTPLALLPVTKPERQESDIGGLQSWLRDPNQQGGVARFDLNFLSCYLSRIIVGAGELARDALRQFLYLGPLREIPSRGYRPERSLGTSRWPNGLGAWDQLYNQGEALTSKVNAWLANPGRLDAGYEIRYKEFKPIALNSSLMTALRNGGEELQSNHWVQEQLAEIPTKRQVKIFDLRSNVELYPEDLGTGISQVLPVLVAAFEHNRSIVAIEQPELHVHPKFQIELGELFIHAIHANQPASNTVFILETHSEYMMLRFLRRLYDTANNELEPGTLPLTPEDIAVYYVNPINEGAEIVHLALSEEGEFLDRWPNGFFPERKKELF